MKRLLFLSGALCLGACTASRFEGAPSAVEPLAGDNSALSSQNLRGAALAALIDNRGNETGSPEGAQETHAAAAPQQTLFYEADLPSDIWERLVDLDDEHAQRRFALLWAGVEAKVAQHVLQREAARRQCSVVDLLALEVESKVGTPSDEAIRDLWSTYRHVIQTSFATARTQLKQLWRADRASQLRHALIDRLRTSTDLKLALEVPRLSRHTVRLSQAPRRGDPQAPVTVVAFGDYECPYSAQARRLLQSLEELYPDRLQVVYRDFVLPQHRRGQAAAQAAACAAEQGNAAYWAYFNLLFDNNQNLEPKDLQHYASRAELNLEDFKACLASARPQQAVAQSLADAAAAQVTGAPVLFINGMRIQGVLPLPLMQAIVEHEIAG